MRSNLESSKGTRPRVTFTVIDAWSVRDMRVHNISCSSRLVDLVEEALMNRRNIRVRLQWVEVSQKSGKSDELLLPHSSDSNLSRQLHELQPPLGEHGSDEQHAQRPANYDARSDRRRSERRSWVSDCNLSQELGQARHRWPSATCSAWNRAERKGKMSAKLIGPQLKHTS